MTRTSAELCARLTSSDLKAYGFIANASNHTLLVQVGTPEDGVAGVYKPRRGERPLWDYPEGTLCDREAAAYAVSDFLGWDVVPPTVLREDGPMGAGSIQLFVAHDPEEHYFTLVDDETTHPALVRMAYFDLLVNNGDRKGGHVLRADDGSVWGCDHGLTFHADPKLRTVVWDLGGHPIPPELRGDVARLASDLTDRAADITRRLSGLLAPAELTGLARRAGILRGLSALPDVEPDRRPYPWPPV